MGIFDSLGKSPLEKEIAKYEKLVSEKPENASMRNILGDLYLKKGLISKAAGVYRETISLFIRGRQNEKAVALLKKLIGHDLFEPKEIDEIFRVLLAKGLKDEVIALSVQLARKKLTVNRPLANDVFRKILELDPENAEALLFFGQGKTETGAASYAMKNETEELQATETTGMAPAGAFPDTPSEMGKTPQVTDDKTAATGRTGKAVEPEQRQQIRIRVPEKPVVERQTAETSAEALKDKFIDLAKEKKHLETTILEQNDAIRKLEREKSELSQKFGNLSDANKKLKDKLLDFDILRNMEISELKKKIDDLISENKKLQLDRESLLATLPDDQLRLAAENGLEKETLIREKDIVEQRLLKTEEDLRHRDSTISKLQEEHRSLVEANRKFAADTETLRLQARAVREEDDKVQRLLRVREEELEGAKAQLSDTLARLHALEQELTELRGRSDAPGDEASVLQEKILAGEQEIRDLKVDIEDLTNTMEAKIHEGDQLRERLALAEQQLRQKEKELNEKIPSLRAKINRLAEIVDVKLEEHSLFAKELADVNQKLVSLHEEMVRKDELLNEISEDYRRGREQEEETLARHDAEKSLLVRENEELRRSLADLRNNEERASQTAQELEREQHILEEQLSGALKKVLELEQTVNSLQESEEKEKIIAELRAGHETEKAVLGERLELLATELEEARASVESGESAVAELRALHREEMGSLKTELSEMARVRDQLLSDLEASNRRITEIEDQRAREIKALREDLARLAGEHEQYRSELERKGQAGDAGTQQERALLMAQIRSLEEENIRVSAALQAAVRASADKEKVLKSALAQLREEVERKGREDEAFRLEGETHRRIISDLKSAHEEEIFRISQILDNSRAEQRRLEGESETKDQVIAEIKQDLHREVANLVMDIEGLKEEKTVLEAQMRELVSEREGLAGENARLAEMLSRAGAEKEELRRGIEEAAERARQEISSCELTISELKTDLDEALRENAVLRESGPGTPEGLPSGLQGTGLRDERARTVPLEKTPVREVAAGNRGKKSWLIPVLAVFMLAVAGIGGIIYFQSRGHDTQAPQIPAGADPKPVAQPVRVPATYHEIYDSLTRQQKTESSKVQGILLTEALMRASDDRKDAGKFEFSRYRYIKLTVNALKGPLNREIMEDPASQVKLVYEGGTLRADGDIARKELRVFSRREEPVSLTFLAAFPLEGLKGDIRELRLVVARNQEEIPLVWNLQDLRALQIIP